jgi:hypothetical protein
MFDAVAARVEQLAGGVARGGCATRNIGIALVATSRAARAAS